MVHKINISKEKLEELYLNKKLTLLEIGVLYKTTKQAVRYWMLKYGIKRRPLSVALKGRIPWNRGKKGVCYNTGRTHFRKGHPYGNRFKCGYKPWNKDKPYLQIMGKNNPNWAGGYEPYYGLNWRKQRKLVLIRDNYTCQECNITKNELVKNPNVHHIIPFREFGRKRYEEANNLKNLITLCNICHKKVEWRNIHENTSNNSCT